jgi:hypothetical protein
MAAKSSLLQTRACDPQALKAVIAAKISGVSLKIDALEHAPVDTFGSSGIALSTGTDCLFEPNAISSYLAGTFGTQH